MIVRIWRGQAESGSKADAYHRHFSETVAPELQALRGNRGAWLLRRDFAGKTEFLAVTFWESVEAIRGFAGDNVLSAIVEPEARAVLAAFDDFARHYELAFRMERPA